MIDFDSKRHYHKPVLETRPLELGVFGDYGDGGAGGGDNDPPAPAPIKIIRNGTLHME